MIAPDRIWLVLRRDISHAVRIPDEPRVVASLVFDMGTGLVLANRVGSSEEDAIEQACEMALTRPAGGVAPGRPDQVLCNPGLASLVESALGRMRQALPVPPIAEVPPVHEAEDIFDAFVGHMAGRRDAADFAAPGDWQLLFDHILRFYERKVWDRWADDVCLLVEIGIGRRSRPFTAIVLGHEEIQHGLVLYPGRRAPAGLRVVPADRPPPMPAGTLMLNLDPPQDLPAEFVMKAARYGWPEGADLVPLFLTVDGRKAGEPGTDDVRTLTAGVAAVLEHDAVGPTIVTDGPLVTNGQVVLANGEPATFGIRLLPPDEVSRRPGPAGGPPKPPSPQRPVTRRKRR